MNNKKALMNYIQTNFMIGLEGMNFKFLSNILDWVWLQSMDKADTIKCLMCLLDGTGITEAEISQFIDWD